MPDLTCHTCGAGFTSVRRDARSCSPACRQSVCRGGKPINRRTSPTKRRQENELFDLNMVLCERYYATKPADRPAYLEHLIDTARAGNGRMREVLSNLVLLKASEGRRATNLRSSRSYPTIAQEANQFTQETWGVHIRDAVRDQRLQTW